MTTERQKVRVVSPADVEGAGEAGPFPFDLYQRRYLAQGDSWFSIGAIPPTLTTRLVEELTTLRSTVIVNCAYPGATLHRMINTTTSPRFRRLLAGPMAYKWDAILFSGVGNDVIAAAGAAPSLDPADRLLRTPAERAPKPGAAGYISEPGWTKLAEQSRHLFNQLVDLRDSDTTNRGTPLILHNYARVTPRPAGTIGFGPWLLPALDAYRVPPGDQMAVADELTRRIATLVAALADERNQRNGRVDIFVADSMHAGVVPAQPETTGASGDWINEIHLTRDGYKKAAKAWEAVLDRLG